MAEYTAIAAQIVATGANAILLETPVRGSNCISHREGSGQITLRGQTGQCRARYRISYGANIAVPTGGTVGEISLALSINGEPLPATLAAATPAAVENLWHVSGDTYIDVDRGCCVTAAVTNTSGQPVTVANLNVIAERTA